MIFFLKPVLLFLNSLIFQEMMGLNLVGEEWLAMESLGIYAWIAIITGILLTVGALLTGGWYYWQNRAEVNESITEGIEAAKDQVTKWIKPEEEKDRQTRFRRESCRQGHLRRFESGQVFLSH